MTRSELTALAQSHGCRIEPAKRDYIPDGPVLERSDLKNAKRIEPPQYTRCGTQVSDDLQSGPIYCGSWATTVLEVTKNNTKLLICWCDRHTPHEHR